MAKANSRWKPGNERYNAAQKRELEKFKSVEGWRGGAKVYRRASPTG